MFTGHVGFVQQITYYNRANPDSTQSGSGWGQFDRRLALIQRSRQGAGKRFAQAVSSTDAFNRLNSD
ncbi:MAG: hypothetical protein Q8K43_06545, partial [Sulfurimicrobium sp.]|nr:hypothetical protein [Sulfurimicrobium sp.]